MKPSGVWIVDVDGTLVDSRGAHLSAFCDALAEHGIAARSVPAELLDCLPHETILGMASRPLSGERLAEILRRKRGLYLAACEAGLEPMPGARELLAALRAGGVRVIATGPASREETAASLDAASLTSGIDDILGFPEESRVPPQQKLLQVLEEVDPSRGRALMLGDSPRDLRAAAAAGIPMLALRCGGYGESELEGAAGIYDDPAQLLAVLTAGRGFSRVAGRDHGHLATLP